MSNAHRPTFHPARGGGTQTTTEGGYFHGGSRGAARSAKEQPSHKRLKFRAVGQSSVDEVAARDLQRELEAKERDNFERLRREREKRGGAPSAATAAGALLLADAPAGGRRSDGTDPALAAFDDADDDAAFAGAADEDGGDDVDGASGFDDDDEEDDSAELLRELERIRHEREEERARKERELEELASKETTEAVLRGNPLLTKGAGGVLGAAGATSYCGSAAVKRRFGDDTVFSHTHAAEPDAKRRFINDSIRSDFHRSFMRRFIH